MIPEAAITHWATGAPWPTRTQIEQDLLLSRLICEIANDSLLGQELMFRGGTCFHKLHLQPARRYSEDLDYVRTSGGGIKDVTDALQRIGKDVGFEKITTEVSRHPKVFLRTLSADGLPIKIKIEMNTRERSPAEPCIRIPYTVQSPWWSDTAQVLSFTTRELVATKIRALYERDKGRDVFDLWLALTELGLTGEGLLEVFGPYHSKGITAASSVANLRAKLTKRVFIDDLAPFVVTPPENYDLREAAELIIDTVLSKIGPPPADERDEQQEQQE